MKKLFIAFALTSALFSCKKETTNTNSSTNSSNGVTCVENPNINFTSIGTPVGKFSDCIKDIDGNVYKTVTIGTQTWMAENLKTSKYTDGTLIPNVKDSLEWIKLTTGAWCYYENDEKYNAKYGKLYNWYALSPTTNGNKNVCPTGWHVPSQGEWTILTDYLGGESAAGGKLKEVGNSSWKNPNIDATNVSGFTALPGGGRDIKGYIDNNVGGYYWSSSEKVESYAWGGVFLNYSAGSLDSGSENKLVGLNVRCVMD
jgi:uncharacterized protein (TIGR02145 family)